MTRWKMAGRLALLLTMMTTILTGCGGVFDPQGPVARDQYFMISLTFFTMMLVLLVVFVLFAFVLIRYRKRKGQTGYPVQVEGSHKLEIVWTVIPFIIVVILSAYTVGYSFKDENQTKHEDNMQVKVIAHQFWWEFVYTDLDIRTAQDLVIPQNTWVTVELESTDVIHSFWVPQLAGKMDLNPGLTNRMSFKADDANKVFLGKCAELCGPSHALMDFKVVTKTEADFEAWIAKMKTPVAVTETTKAGDAIFAGKCLSCHAISVDAISPGPNLAGIASREKIAGILDNTDEDMRRWILDPGKYKPVMYGAKALQMPQVDLTDQELDDLIIYLRSLK